MWFLIGSQAIKKIKEDFYRDISFSDIDLYCSETDFKELLEGKNNIEKCFPLKKNKYRLKITNYPIIELKIYTEGSVYHWLAKKEQKDIITDKIYYLNNIQINIPNIQCLKAIKESHIYWPIHWLKNIEDLTWLKEHSCPYNKKEKEFKRKIKNEMKKLHGNIPYGKVTEKNNWKELIQSIDKSENYEENMIFFIHYKLSLKNKINVIKKWEQYKSILTNNIRNDNGLRL